MTTWSSIPVSIEFRDELKARKERDYGGVSYERFIRKVMSEDSQ